LNTYITPEHMEIKEIKKVSIQATMPFTMRTIIQIIDPLEFKVLFLVIQEHRTFKWKNLTAITRERVVEEGDKLSQTMKSSLLNS